jgi:hypothetical protein
MKQIFNERYVPFTMSLESIKLIVKLTAFDHDRRQLSKADPFRMANGSRRQHGSNGEIVKW